MSTRKEQQMSADPWDGKGDRYMVIAALAFLSCLAFAAYDGQGFHAKYLRLCSEQPGNAECRPLNLVKEARRPDLGITLDYGKGKWALGVGPRQEETQANDLASQLRSAGAEPRVIKLPGGGKKAWYQVQLGRFPDRKGATEAGKQLQAKGLIQDFQLVDYQTER